MNVSLGFAAAVGFVELLALTLLYGLRSKWWTNPLGWVMLGSFAIKAIIYGMILAGRIWGPLGYLPWLVAVAVFDLVQAGWLVLLVRAQRQDRGR